MQKLLSILGLTLATMVIAFAGTVPAAYAAAASPRVVVPDRPAPGGGGIGGCYTIQERLYGPYTMNFCVGSRGTYTVTGGGLNCNGRLTSTASGRTLNIRLQRTSCGRGKAWSADRITCQSNGIIGGLVPFVAVPDKPGRPSFSNLITINCTYMPSERGYKDMRVRARRTS